MECNTIVSNQGLGQSIGTQHLILGPLRMLADLHLHSARSAKNNKTKISIQLIRKQIPLPLFIPSKKTIKDRTVAQQGRATFNHNQR